VITLRTDQILR